MDELIAPIAFEGGVAANAGVVRALADVLGLQDGVLLVPPHFATLGAIGAALLATTTDSVARRFETLADVGPLLARGDYARTTLEPLGGAHGTVAESAHTAAAPWPDGGQPAFLGVDVGSISTNLAVLAEDGTLLAKRYLMTAGRPIEAVQQGLQELDEVGERVEICGVGTTGSGRYMIGDIIGADVICNEITAQARAAVELDPQVDTILEIGGQDSKYIRTQDGVVVDFEMNKVCAAGTGSFLEEQAGRLGMAIEEEFGRLALEARQPVRLGERCSVFMGSDVGHHQARGAAREDIAAGLCYSIVDNYLQRVVRGKKIGQRVFFQGGVAFNEGVRAAFGKVLGREVVVPPNHEVSGAIGCALAARDEGGGGATRFKGFQHARQPVETTSFVCEDCPNRCDVSRVVTGGDAALHYGSRCGKFDERTRRPQGGDLPDLFRERERLLCASLKEARGRLPETAPTIGIPRCMVAYHEQLPFWAAFFSELRFGVVLSAKSSKRTIEQGIELCKSEFCFPIKVAHGHVQDLVDRGVDTIFLPAIIDMHRAPDANNTLACPYVEALPDIITASLRLDRRDVALCQPVLHYRRGERHLQEVLTRACQELVPGIDRSDVGRAFRAGSASQEAFQRAVKRRGREVLGGLAPDLPAVVMVGRAYNTCDPEISLQIPAMLRQRGALVIPLDFLPLEEVDISDLWPSMYWYHGQRILKAAELVRRRRDLEAAYITNFGCGPDSFILSYFARAMADKPYLEVELDEHSAGAGVITRCEAFLDSLAGRRRAGKSEPPAARRVLELCRTRPQEPDRTFYLPRFSDHWMTVAAALRACGVKAEVLPESSEESLRVGRRHGLGKECLAYTVITGDVLQKVRGDDFDAASSAFLGVRMGGPCRVGQYLPSMELMVNDHTDAFVPFYKQPASFQEPAPVFRGVDRRKFERLGGYGVFAVDLLFKAVLQTRPYEVHRGETDRLYRELLHKICDVTEGGGDVVAVLRDARRAFESVAVDRTRRRPVIGLLGQAFYIYNRAVNCDIIGKLENLGLEVRAPLGAEMGLYQYYSMKHICRLKKQRAKLLGWWFFDRVIRHRMTRLMRLFDGFFEAYEEPCIEELVELNREYLDPSLITETTLSVGKTFHHHRHGSDGVILLMSFCCMPGAISDAIMSGRLREDLGGFPYLRLSFDAQEQTNVDTRIEAFAYQAEQYMRSRTS